jgi:flagellar basal body-associated protein FliL
MPIFILAVIALAVFVAMGLMLFYAAYKESHSEEQSAAAPKPVAR